MKKSAIFSLGDVVGNRITSEEAYIVRIYEDLQQTMASGEQIGGVAYVVSLPATDISSAKEALWREDDVISKESPSKIQSETHRRNGNSRVS